MRRCGAVAEPRPDAVECAHPSGYLAARLCPCSDGHSAVFCLSAAETKVWVALEGVADCCSGPFWASAWYGQQGEHFVAVDHRRCIRMPFVPPCLMYNLSILQKRCATKGSARQKLGKRYERRKTHGLKNLYMRPMSVRPSGGRQQWAANCAVRPKNGAARFAVLPSVELQAELLCQGRILKPRNKSARQNGPRKG